MTEGGRVARRPVTGGDRQLLFDVYASTRADELSVVPWDDATKHAFLSQQFEAQDMHYRQHYPDGSFDVIEIDGEPAGRLYVERGEREIRIVDIALLPAFRSRGVGTRLLRELVAEAGAAGKRLSIHVEINNPARRLYERLGFVPHGDAGVYLLMALDP